MNEDPKSEGEPEEIEDLEAPADEQEGVVGGECMKPTKVDCIGKSCEQTKIGCIGTEFPAVYNR